MYRSEIRIPSLQGKSGFRGFHVVVFVPNKVSVDPLIEQEINDLITDESSNRTILKARDGSTLSVCWYKGLEVFDVFVKEKDEPGKDAG
jgi:hypothetical protein